MKDIFNLTIESKRSYLSELPLPILLRIFSFLKPNDLSAVSRASSRLHITVNLDSTWILMYLTTRNSFDSSSYYPFAPECLPLLACLHTNQGASSDTSQEQTDESAQKSASSVYVFSSLSDLKTYDVFSLLLEADMWTFMYDGEQLNEHIPIAWMKGKSWKRVYFEFVLFTRGRFHEQTSDEVSSYHMSAVYPIKRGSVPYFSSFDLQLPFSSLHAISFQARFDQSHHVSHSWKKLIEFINRSKQAQVDLLLGDASSQVGLLHHGRKLSPVTRDLQRALSTRSPGSVRRLRYGSYQSQSQSQSQLQLQPQSVPASDLELKTAAASQIPALDLIAPITVVEDEEDDEESSAPQSPSVTRHSFSDFIQPNSSSAASSTTPATSTPTRKLLSELPSSVLASYKRFSTSSFGRPAVDAEHEARTSHLCVLASSYADLLAYFSSLSSPSAGTRVSTKRSQVGNFGACIVEAVLHGPSDSATAHDASIHHSRSFAGTPVPLSNGSSPVYITGFVIGTPDEYEKVLVPYYHHSIRHFTSVIALLDASAVYSPPPRTSHDNVEAPKTQTQVHTYHVSQTIKLVLHLFCKIISFDFTSAGLYFLVLGQDKPHGSISHAERNFIAKEVSSTLLSESSSIPVQKWHKKQVQFNAFGNNSHFSEKMNVRLEIKPPLSPIQLSWILRFELSKYTKYHVSKLLWLVKGIAIPDQMLNETLRILNVERVLSREKKFDGDTEQLLNPTPKQTQPSSQHTAISFHDLHILYNPRENIMT
jgi:hypothetical protein